MKNQKILKDKDLPDKDEREYYYNQFLNQLNEDMKKEKELKDLKPIKTKTSIKHRKIDSYDKFVDDISKDMFKQNNERKNKIFNPSKDEIKSIIKREIKLIIMQCLMIIIIILNKMDSEVLIRK